MESVIRYRADEAAPDASARLYRDLNRGRVARVARGAYLSTAEWTQLSPVERHLVQARATQVRRPWVVFSHRTAALIHGLPLIGSPGERPEAMTMLGHGRSTPGTQLHRTTAAFDTVEVDGITVTSLERTLADIARTQPWEVSVPMLDAALARPPAEVDVELLDRELARSELRGHERARRAWTLADGRSGSPGESLSRVVIHRLGFPPPELQARFDDVHGLVGLVDYWWPERQLIGEFDGLAKYQREEFTRGRSTAEVVLAEKHREDRLRRLGPRVVRWGWAEATSPRRLAEVLHAAGLRSRRGALQ